MKEARRGQFDLGQLVWHPSYTSRYRTTRNINEKTLVEAPCVHCSANMGTALMVFPLPSFSFKCLEYSLSRYCLSSCTLQPLHADLHKPDFSNTCFFSWRTCVIVRMMNMADWIVHYFFSSMLFLTILFSKQSPEQNLTPNDCLMSNKGDVDDCSRLRSCVYEHPVLRFQHSQPSTHAHTPQTGENNGQRVTIIQGNGFSEHF